MLYDLVLPALGAAIAGGAVGMEREYRGRAAGLRTHTLVCLASALLMVAAMRQREWSFLLMAEQAVVIDPTRMAHGILTGIGFLCGGVIFREGFSVHGLTTAASLWVTTTLGILFGVGLYGLAVGGTLATLGVLVGLRLLDAKLPRRAAAELAVRYLRQDALSEQELRAMLSEFGLTPGPVRHRLLENGRVMEQATTAIGSGPMPSEALAARLAATPKVLEFELLPFGD